MKKFDSQKCNFCDYPLGDAIPVEDLQGNKAVSCRNCGNVTITETPNLGKLCPQCNDRMINYKNGGQVFECKKCRLFMHEGDVYYSLRKGNHEFTN
jgi:Zn-finger protein